MVVAIPKGLPNADEPAKPIGSSRLIGALAVVPRHVYFLNKCAFIKEVQSS